jgi:hypothetical protein
LDETERAKNRTKSKASQGRACHERHLRQELLEQRAYEQAEKTRVGLQDSGNQLYRLNSTSRDEAPAQREA